MYPVLHTIRTELQKRNKGIADIARELNLKYSTANAYFNGYLKMPSELRERISTLLGISREKLFPEYSPSPAHQHTLPDSQETSDSWKRV